MSTAWDDGNKDELMFVLLTSSLKSAEFRAWMREVKNKVSDAVILSGYALVSWLFSCLLVCR